MGLMVGHVCLFTGGFLFRCEVGVGGSPRKETIDGLTGNLGSAARKLRKSKWLELKMELHVT